MNDLVYTDLLHSSFQVNANRPCLHIKRNGEYQSWTYKDFHRDLDRLCHVLKKHGLKKGENGIVIGENTPEWVIAYHGIFLTGACTVPVDPNIPPSEIESILTVTRAKIVFCSLTYLNLFRNLKKKHDFLERIVTLDIQSKEKEPHFDQYIKKGNAEHNAFSNSFSSEDPISIIFTSGTTGKAKGVVLTQKNFTSVSQYAIPRMKAGPQDTMCAVLPLHHVFGFAACCAATLASGMDIVFVPYMKGPLILEALKDKGVTILPAVPKMIALFHDSIMHNVKKKGPMVKTIFGGMKTISAATGNIIGSNFKRTLFSGVHKNFGGKLRLVISGGAALGKKYWTGFNQLGFEIVEGYGLSETFGPITLCPKEDPRLGSVGFALEGNEMKIVDPDEHGIGEVCFRGNCVFKEYYKNEELTKEVFDEDGWFHTGDLGKTDKNGFLYLSGRKKDMIVLDSGKNVYPDELEDFYGESLLIEEIGIFGITQDNREIVAAIIVPSKEIRTTKTVKEATDIIYEELVRLGKKLPVYRRINDFVTLFTPLPRTTTRKLKKQELIKLYNSIRRKSQNRLVPDDQLSVIEMALMETEEYIGIVGGITQVSQKIDPHIINLRSHLEIDLGMDSLMLIELLSYIENRFSITINDEVFEKMETVGDIVSLIREQKSDNAKTSADRVMGLKERILADNIEDYRFEQKYNFVTRAAGPALHKLATRISGINSYGTEALFQKNKPLIFASNHNHPFDAFWILNALPDSIRINTVFPGDSKGQKYPLLPYSIYLQNVIRLQRYNDPIEALKFSLSIIRKNRHLIIFPEANVSRSGTIGQFKSGIGLLARETDAAIVPVKIVSPLHLKSVNPLYNTGKKSVVFGTPVTVDELIADGKCPPNCSADEIAQQIRSLIVNA